MTVSGPQPVGSVKTMWTVATDNPY